MPRPAPFTSASLAGQFKPRMAEAFPVMEDMPSAMRDLLERLARPRPLTISDRLLGLKRLFDEEGFAAA